VSDDDNTPRSELVLYQTEDGRTRIECRFDNETIWLTQAQLAELFQTTPQNITIHLKSIYEDDELGREATCKDYLQVRQEGPREVSRSLLHYSLPVILAVGYRVRSLRGTQFRQWATARLTELLVKGFTMDDERLKNPPGPGVPDYFDELLERIRDIRASEKRMYTRVRDIIALAADYRPSSSGTTRIFQVIQNKLHHAVTGKTAPELIAERVDAKQPNMGLTTWSGDKVRKHDVTVAKNYLRDEEITALNRIVVMFLDFADDQTQRRRQVHLAEWPIKLDEFLRFNERDVLDRAGKIRRAAADRKAKAEFEEFAKRRRRVAEQEGQQDGLRALEDAAKGLPKRNKRDGENRGAQS
jgi:hypothetical protein